MVAWISQPGGGGGDAARICKVLTSERSHSLQAARVWMLVIYLLRCNQIPVGLTIGGKPKGGSWFICVQVGRPAADATASASSENAHAAIATAQAQIRRRTCWHILCHALAAIAQREACSPPTETDIQDINCFASPARRPRGDRVRGGLQGGQYRKLESLDVTLPRVDSRERPYGLQSRSIREEMLRMGNNPEGRGETSDPRLAIQKEIFKTIIEVQEKKATTASDPKERENAQRLAEVAKKNLRDLK